MLFSHYNYTWLKNRKKIPTEILFIPPLFCETKRNPRNCIWNFIYFLSLCHLLLLPCTITLKPSLRTWRSLQISFFFHFRYFNRHERRRNEIYPCMSQLTDYLHIFYSSFHKIVAKNREEKKRKHNNNRRDCTGTEKMKSYKNVYTKCSAMRSETWTQYNTTTGVCKKKRQCAMFVSNTVSLPCHMKTSYCTSYIIEQKRKKKLYKYFLCAI